MISRRTFVLQAAGLVAAGATARRVAAQLVWPGGGPDITVYKSSSCGCCAKWVDYIRAAEFLPTVSDEADMDSVKDRLGVPAAVRSCHTAVVGKYLIEGHVPAREIRRLLQEKPEISGLAAPGMPSEAPGMAPPGTPPSDFEVVAFRRDGSTYSFARY